MTHIYNDAQKVGIPPFEDVSESLGLILLEVLALFEVTHVEVQSERHPAGGCLVLWTSIYCLSIVQQSYKNENEYVIRLAERPFVQRFLR